MAFDPQAYGPAVADLLETDRLPALGPGTPDPDVRPALQCLKASQLVVDADHDIEMAACCVSGLWLLYDYLDESHTISQRIKTQSGSYWHGIMHRREPDPQNAKYWFRSVGNHAIFPDLCSEATALAEGLGTHPNLDEAGFLRSQKSWDPFAFIDLCEAARGSGNELELLCCKIQRREWELLFDDCFKQITS